MKKKLRIKKTLEIQEKYIACYCWKYVDIKLVQDTDHVSLYLESYTLDLLVFSILATLLTCFHVSSNLHKTLRKEIMT